MSLTWNTRAFGARARGSNINSSDQYNRTFESGS